MAFLDPVQLVLTPMTRAVFAWEGPGENDIAPIDYLVVAVSTNPAHTVQKAVATGAPLIARLDLMYRLATYTITVTARYADPDDNVSATYDSFVMDPQCGYGQVLRQAVFDIFLDAGIVHLSRPLQCLHDGYFLPIEWPNSRGGLSVEMPAIEIGDPELDSCVFATNSRIAEKWNVPIRIMDNGSAQQADPTSTLWLLFEKVRRAVDNKEQLGLGMLGVHQRSWEWRKKKKRFRGRDRMTGFALELLVPVQRAAGTVVMP